MDIFKSLIIAGLKSEETKIIDFKIDFEGIIEKQSMQLVFEIKSILGNDIIESDFDCIEKILTAFSKYNIDISYRHDFG